MHALLLPETAAAVPVHLVTSATLDAALATLPGPARAFAGAMGFAPKAGRHLVVPDADGKVCAVLFGDSEPDTHRDPFLIGKLPSLLPPGDYRLAGTPAAPDVLALAWIAGQYRFTRYAGTDADRRRLALPAGADAATVTREAEALTLARDLINTPANDLGPAELEAAIRDLAARHGAVVTSTVGEALLAARLPMIHAVGMGSPRAPRLIDLVWGDPTHPRITLVGKGVCFDTGGLDIKPDAAMLLMKKDMGGAAAAIGAAHVIMAAGVPVRLRLLVPAVENAVSGEAFRPGDVFPTRKGITVEIGNTDAEGRLILADALTLADEDDPDLLFDFSTLTGAARVALGAELPAIFTPADTLAADLARAGEAIGDPVWRLPLWAPYARGLDSRIADMNNVATGGMAGAITAALFLERFVEKARGRWLHADLYAWVASERPGRPVGGEWQVGRAVAALVRQRYG